MPRIKGQGRANTVGSIVHHGEFLSMTLLHREVGESVEFNWRCSCGSEGREWFSTATRGHPRAVAALAWTGHVSGRHPEVEHPMREEANA